MILNKSKFLAALDREEDRVKTIFRNRVRKVVSEAMRRLIAKTPVHTGATVASYVASTSGATRSHPGFGYVEPTSNLPLGAEKNRAPAASVANATLAALNFDDPFQKFTITNAAPQARLLEIGGAPDPETTRAPAGMFGVTNQELISLLASGKL